MRASDAHKLALSLPDTVEQDHHGFPSYRIAGKIFATRPDTQHFHVMLDEDDITAAVAAHPASCEAKYWGKKLTAVRVDVSKIARGDFQSLLLEAWERRQSR